MKVLFITTNNVNDINGGAKASLRNIECLQELYGKENVFAKWVYNPSLSSFLAHAIFFLRKLFSGFLFPTLKDLQISPNKYDIIFFDSSLFGCQIQSLKRDGYGGKIVAFFHNCEADYKAIFYKGKMTIGGWLYLCSIRKNEIYTIKYADACAFINERDMKRTTELYGIESRKSEVITMTMKDAYHEIPLKKKDEDKPIYTILGSYFKPNVDGIVWFVKNVIPYVNIKLRVVGKNMHLLNNDIDCKNIEIFSNVPDLDIYMAESDYMLYPIFEGSGMKIKTCEALMWGKNIVGTPEAFSGYGITDYSKVGACCKTSDEFIAAIRSLNLPKYNQWSRQYYKDYFSFQKSINLYRRLVCDF